MRTFLLCILLAAWAASSLLAAESTRAPDIPAGTRSAEVIRQHGWPKGKSMRAGGRENWLYPNFQIRVQNDRVVSVDYIAPEVPIRSRSPAPRPRENLDPSTPVPTHSAATQGLPTAPTIPRSINPTQTKAPVSSPPRPSGSAIIQPQDTFQLSPQRLPPPNTRQLDKTTPPPATRLWIGFSVVFVAALSALGIGTLVARRRTSEMTASSLPPSPWAPRQDWKDSVAQQLDRANRRELLPPSLSEPPPFAQQPATPPSEGTESAAELNYSVLDQLEWKRFELVVQRYYAATGLKAEFTKSGADGGVDICLYCSGEQRPFSYVQCKAWGQRIDVGTVRELRGVMASEGVAEGVLAATGEFTAEARLFCSKNAITPLTGQAFTAKFNDLPPTERRRILAEVLAGDYTTPSCPQCEKKMVWRENGGFWSCATFRKCGSTPIHARKTRKLQIPARDEARAF